MSELIERMARAAWEANRERCAAEVPDLAAWDDETEALREDWRTFMRAGLAAAREPTKGMIDATGEPGVPDGHYAELWRQMVDAALTA